MSKQQVALITGITGQDGSYLAELLLDKAYIVHGIKRRASSFNTDRVDHIFQDPHVDNARFKLHYGDLSDSTTLIRIIQETQPDEIYIWTLRSSPLFEVVPKFLPNTSRPIAHTHLVKVDVCPRSTFFGDVSAYIHQHPA